MTVDENTVSRMCYATTLQTWQSVSTTPFVRAGQPPSSLEKVPQLQWFMLRAKLSKSCYCGMSPTPTADSHVTMAGQKCPSTMLQRRALGECAHTPPITWLFERIWPETQHCEGAWVRQRCELGFLSSCHIFFRMINLQHNECTAPPKMNRANQKKQVHSLCE